MDTQSVATAVGWALSVAAAAFIGATIARVYNRARPRVWIVEIRPSLSINGKFVTDKTEVPVPDRLRRLIEKTVWAGLQPFRDQSIAYKSLVTEVNTVERQMIQLRRHIDRFRHDLPGMRQLLDKGDRTTDAEKHSFFDLWERNDNFIYTSLQGDYRRGKLRLDPKTYEGRPHLSLEMDTRKLDDKQVDMWVVAKPGGRFNSALFPRTEKDLPFQKEVMHALAYFDASRLGEYLTSVTDDLEEEEVATEILRAIQQVRTDLSRWAVTVGISNSGSAPIAFLPSGELIIETRGLIHNGKEMADSTVVKLEIRDRDGEPSPVQSAGGSAMLTTLASKEFVMELPLSEMLVSAFNMGACECHLRLFASGGLGAHPRTEYRTGKVRFAPGDLEVAR